MPRWDFQCVVCNNYILDHDRRDCDCPSCGWPMWRMPSAPSFVLKGKGFHSVDYPKGANDSSR